MGHTVEMPSVRFLASAVSDRLRAAGSLASDEEAAELLAEAPNAETLESWIVKREAGEPLAWITGYCQFSDHRVRIDPGVYVPRAQSEELARRAARTLEASGKRAADLCTGCGAIALHMTTQVPDAKVVAVDIDMRAVASARRNGIPAVVGDLDRPLRQGVFDVVTAVAPYVPTGQLRLLPRDVQRYEPRLALDGGEDGLDIVRRVIVAASRLLVPGGWVLLELGGEQDKALIPNLIGNGFGPASTWCDEDGDLRGLAAQSN
jgi:release factor glutamine methyltransferase